MYPDVHCSTIYNSQDMETTWITTNRQMDKEDVVYVHNGILLSQETGSFVEMRLSKVCHTDWSQKNKYHILAHACGIQKNGADEPTCKAGTETQKDRKDTWPHRGRGSWDELEVGFDINTPPCVKLTDSGNFLHSTGSLAQCSVMTYLDGMETGKFKREVIYL